MHYPYTQKSYHLIYRLLTFDTSRICTFIDNALRIKLTDVLTRNRVHTKGIVSKYIKHNKCIKEFSIISLIAVQCLSYTKWDNYTFTFHAISLDESITHNIPHWNKTIMTYFHRKASDVCILRRRTDTGAFAGGHSAALADIDFFCLSGYFSFNNDIVVLRYPFKHGVG